MKVSKEIKFIQGRLYELDLRIEALNECRRAKQLSEGLLHSHAIMDIDANIMKLIRQGNMIVNKFIHGLRLEITLGYPSPQSLQRAGRGDNVTPK